MGNILPAREVQEHTFVWAVRYRASSSLRTKSGSLALNWALSLLRGLLAKRLKTAYPQRMAQPSHEEGRGGGHRQTSSHPCANANHKRL